MIDDVKGFLDIFIKVYYPYVVSKALAVIFPNIIVIGLFSCIIWRDPESLTAAKVMNILSTFAVLKVITSYICF